MSKEELIQSLNKGHEYQWTYEGKEYSLLLRRGTGMIWFYSEDQAGKEYRGIEEVIADGYDLLTMMTDNPTLDEF